MGGLRPVRTTQLERRLQAAVFHPHINPNLKTKPPSNRDTKSVTACADKAPCCSRMLLNTHTRDVITCCT